jgi:hypothetical protein
MFTATLIASRTILESRPDNQRNKMQISKNHMRTTTRENRVLLRRLSVVHFLTLWELTNIVGFKQV